MLILVIAGMSDCGTHISAVLRVAIARKVLTKQIK